MKDKQNQKESRWHSFSVQRIVIYFFSPLIDKLEQIRCGIIDVENELEILNKPINDLQPPLHKLIGKQCSIDFNLPHNEWPIAGYPAWGYVTGIEMPLIGLKKFEHDNTTWVNAETIKTIRAAE